MKQHEAECSPEGFYCGSLTAIDLFVFEEVNYLRLLFPKEVAKYPRLNAVRERVAGLAEVRALENSERRVGEFHPVRYFNRFRKERMLERQRQKLMMHWEDETVDLQEESM